MDTIKNRIKLSVCIVTYNHEKYIRQCLDSILNQKTNFEFEVIIGDDCSTDNTRVIVKELTEQYPNKIFSILQEKNIGATKNYFKTHDFARGEYIAHLDGDDYALPGKLQKQVDFLDFNPDFNLVWHRTRYQFSDGQEINDLIDYSKIEKGYSKADLIKFTFLAQHSTKVYRASQRKYCSQPDITIDYFINLEQIQLGKAAYVSDEILGVYRYGLGVSNDPSLKSRHILLDGLLYMTEHSLDNYQEINFAAFILMLSDLKSKNLTLSKSYNLWKKTFSVSSFLKYFALIKKRKLYAPPLHTIK